MTVIWELDTWHTRQCPGIHNNDYNAKPAPGSCIVCIVALSGIVWYLFDILYHIVAYCCNFKNRRAVPVRTFLPVALRAIMWAPLLLRRGLHFRCFLRLQSLEIQPQRISSFPLSIPCGLVVHDAVPRVDRSGDYRTLIIKPFVFRGKRSKGLRMQAYIAKKK